MAGPFIGVRGGDGGYPKSPYHMPRKILGKEVVHILTIWFLIFSYEQLILRIFPGSIP